MIDEFYLNYDKKTCFRILQDTQCFFIAINHRLRSARHQGAYAYSPVNWLREIIADNL
jgi:hypothetical protein